MVFVFFGLLLFDRLFSSVKFRHQKRGALQVSVPPMVYGPLSTAMRLTAWNCKGATRSY
jgi:hypothetical protein